LDKKEPVTMGGLERYTYTLILFYVFFIADRFIEQTNKEG